MLQVDGANGNIMKNLCYGSTKRWLPSNEDMN